MIPNTSYYIDPSWSIGPMVIYILAFLAISVTLLARPSSRGLVGYTALIAALAGLIYNTLIVLAIFASLFLALPAFYVFYAISIAFIFVPGFVAFARISKQKGNKLGKAAACFGYLWAFVIIIIGLALSITFATKLASDNYLDYLSSCGIIHLNNLYIFLLYSPWAFVAAYLVLLGTHSSSLQGKSKMTLIAYSVLNILAVLFFTICINIRDTSDLYVILTVIYSVLLALTEVPFAVALLVATYYGHLWNINVLEGGDKGKSVNPSNTNQIDVEKN